MTVKRIGYHGGVGALVIVGSNVFPPGTLSLIEADDGYLEIWSLAQRAELRVLWSEVMSLDGETFATHAEASGYLRGEFARRPPIEIAPAEAVAPAGALAGQPMAVSRVNGQLVPARADTYSLALVAGLAVNDTAAGFVSTLTREALTLNDWTAIAGTPSLSLGLPYFLGPEGGLTLIPELRAGSGYCNVRLGIATGPQTFAPTILDPIRL